jgi:RNase H-fold protein (predicted Holliday junction resolvase)
MEWDKTVVLTAERLRKFEKKLAERTEDYKEVVATLDEVLPTYDAQETLDTALKNKEIKKATSISTSKVAA